MEDSRTDDPVSGHRLQDTNGRAFTNFVYCVPLLLIPPWLPTRILGCAALAFVLTRAWSAARRDPVLLAFLGFSLAAMFAYDSGGQELRAITVPYIGWSATSPYGYSIFFAVVGLALSVPWGRFSVAWLCLLQVAMGSYDWATAGAQSSLNPYLRTSVWRPVWTVFIPLTWAFMILLVPLRTAEGGESGVAMSGRPTSE